jgi:hypothetical protein
MTICIQMIFLEITMYCITTKFLVQTCALLVRSTRDVTPALRWYFCLFWILKQKKTSASKGVYLFDLYEWRHYTFTTFKISILYGLRSLLICIFSYVFVFKGCFFLINISIKKNNKVICKKKVTLVYWWTDTSSYKAKWYISF